MNTKLWIALGVLLVFVVGIILMLYLWPSGLLIASISFIIGVIGGYAFKAGLFDRANLKRLK